MSVSYDKLWKLLIDKKMSASELRKEASIAPNTLTKMRKEQEVSLSVLGRICDSLQCDFKDIIEYKPNKNMNKGGEDICD
ncbi:helix-turn-helix transcriptional regulator [Faecalitalea cylindroides]|uniref:helix-turn-helix domain-containing protein n=1 Tax=Faecalitalea cylindroides TaxID=39483 RepID=UPI00195EA511|nr:helix-turn-helix transcriptional regulator [Faecalitalea cylindroides]MBM6811115.1 helix-turn-helix transcriptional regulator [Faecalitalea cylindroides]